MTRIVLAVAMILSCAAASAQQPPPPSLSPTPPPSGDSNLDRLMDFCGRHKSEAGLVESCAKVMDKWRATRAAQIDAARAAQEANDRALLDSFVNNKQPVTSSPASH